MPCGLRSLWPQGRGGSSPPFRTRFKCLNHNNLLVEAFPLYLDCPRIVLPSGYAAHDLPAPFSRLSAHVERPPVAPLQLPHLGAGLTSAASTCASPST